MTKRKTAPAPKTSPDIAKLEEQRRAFDAAGDVAEETMKFHRAQVLTLLRRIDHIAGFRARYDGLQGPLDHFDTLIEEIALDVAQSARMYAEAAKDFHVAEHEGNDLYEKLYRLRAALKRGD